MHLATTNFQAPTVHLALTFAVSSPSIPLHFSWQPPYWHKHLFTPGPQHLFGILPLCPSSAKSMQVVGEWWVVGHQGDSLWDAREQGAQAQPPASHDWDLHAPAPGLGLDLAQRHSAQPLPQHPVCMLPLCPGWSLTWLISPTLHCPQRANHQPLRDRAVERGRRMGLPYDQRRLGKKPPHPAP